MFDAIIFDFDGVILNSEPIHYQACNAVLQAIKITLSYEEYLQEYLGLSDKEMFPQILAHKGQHASTAEIEQMITHKIQIYTNIISTSAKLPFIAGLEEYILQNIQNNKPLAICSGATRPEVMVVLDKWPGNSLSRYFKIITTKDDVTEGKPSPEGYLLTAKRLKLEPTRCLVIEDSPSGIQAAKLAGMQVVAFTTEYGQQKLAQADQIVGNFTDLL